MAELFTSDGDPQQPRPADDRAPREGASISIADVPEWVLARVDQVQYPTRMARRRALEAAQITDGWRPDPSITRPLLGRVEDELARLLDRRYVPQPDDGDIAQDPPALRAAPVTDLLPATAASRRVPKRWVAVALLAVVAVGAAAVATSQQPVVRGRTAVAAATQPAQRVLVVALARSGQLTGISLLATDAGGASSGAQQVLVPSRLLLDVPGAGRVQVAQSLAPGPSAPGAAIADALEVRVAGTWVLDFAALSSLVDAVGGVVVDVDVDVPTGPAVGAPVLAAAGGGQRLSGVQAATYAQLVVGDEPEAARLARQERVLTAILAALPADTAQRRALVAALPGAPTGPVLDGVVSVTGALRSAAAARSLASTVVPVRDIDTGGSVTAYGLDSVAAAEMVRARLAGAAIAVPAGGRTRVLVQNGVGTPGLGDSARSLLVAAGLRYVGGGNVDGFGVQESVVLLPDGGPVSRARGSAVARALGLSESALRISESAPTVADLVVVLGRDFRGA